MPDDIAIEVSHLSKKFARSIKRTMWYGLADIAKAGLIPERYRSRHYSARVADAVAATVQPSPVESLLPESPLRPDEFWALRDVTFQIRRGECIGLIGRNGAGKSTLFSILSGIYGPSIGRASIRGRLQALIALGAGFHPLLSGRENIFINAAILGMKTAEINRVLDQILEFAELGQFIDMPVKNYSSGMLVRLGFSIAAHLDPDVLLIDEVLSVGDASFQQKSQQFSLRLVNSGKTIVVVAHNMMTIQAMCSKTIWLQRGAIRLYDQTHQVVERYNEDVIASWAKGPDGQAIAPHRLAIIETVILVQEEREISDVVAAGQPITVQVQVHCAQSIENARLWLCFYTDGTEYPVVGASMYQDGHHLALAQGVNVMCAVFEAFPVADRSHIRIYAGLRDWRGQTMLADSFASPPYRVRNAAVLCTNGAGAAPSLDAAIAPVAVSYRWHAMDNCRLC